jgi:MFS family permease
MPAEPPTSSQEDIMTRATGTRATGTRAFRLLIYGLILASAAAQFGLVPVMPVYAHRLGLSGLQQGLVLGATGLATLAVAMPAGTLSDRYGARRITLAAGLLMAAANAGQALAGSFPALLAARLTFGAGYGVLWTAGLCWLAAGADGPALVARPGPPFPARSPSTSGWPSRCWPRARASP